MQNGLSQRYVGKRLGLGQETYEKLNESEIKKAKGYKIHHCIGHNFFQKFASNAM